MNYAIDQMMRAAEDSDATIDALRDDLAAAEADRDAHRQRADAAEAELATARALADALRESDERLRAENTRFAAAASQAADLAVERNHHRERHYDFAARVDWMQSVAAEAMRVGLATCRDLRGRLRGEALRLTRADAEVARLRAIVEGRTTPPTEAEAAAHNAAGGWWCISRAGVCPPAAVDAFRGDGDVTAHLPFVAGATWLPLDRDGRPCAWPTVTS